MYPNYATHNAMTTNNIKNRPFPSYPIIQNSILHPFWCRSSSICDFKNQLRQRQKDLRHVKLCRCFCGACIAWRILQANRLPVVPSLGCRRAGQVSDRPSPTRTRWTSSKGLQGQLKTLRKNTFILLIFTNLWMLTNKTI